jgi:arsenate reductase
MSVTIYHNPACGTSRNTLAMIRQSGEEPDIIEYLKTPPDRARLIELIKAMGISVRALLREKGTPYAELGLADPKWSDDELIDFMLAHPILINRPIVVTAKGTRLCRPSEKVLDLLDRPTDSFVKEIRRTSRPHRFFYSACERADDCGAAGCDLHCASA